MRPPLVNKMNNLDKNKHRMNMKIKEKETEKNRIRLTSVPNVNNLISDKCSASPSIIPLHKLEKNTKIITQNGFLELCNFDHETHAPSIHTSIQNPRLQTRIGNRVSLWCKGI
jgi:hypothetical protein